MVKNKSNVAAGEYICSKCGSSDFRISGPPRYLLVLWILHVAKSGKGAAAKFIAKEELSNRTGIQGFKFNTLLERLENTRLLIRPWKGVPVFGITREGINVLKRWLERGWTFKEALHKNMESNKKWHMARTQQVKTMKKNAKAKKHHGK